MEISAPLIGSVASGYGVKDPEVGYAENSQGLKEASKDFISILFSYMFQSMRGNPDDQEPDNGDGGFGGNLFGGENVDMFMGFLDQEVGKKFSVQGGQQLVDALYNQLKGNNVFKSDKDSTSTTGNKEKEVKASESVIEKKAV